MISYSFSDQSESWFVYVVSCIWCVLHYLYSFTCVYGNFSLVPAPNTYTKIEGERWEQRLRDGLYQNIRIISKDLGVERSRLSDHVITVDTDRTTKRVWHQEKKTETKWVGEFRKNWTEMRLEVEGKKNVWKKCIPTNIPEHNDRADFRCRIEKHQWNIHKIGIENLRERTSEKRGLGKQNKYWQEKRKLNYDVTIRNSTEVVTKKEEKDKDEWEIFS